MAVTAVVFDVGETLADETRMWSEAADEAGVPRFTLMGVLGGLAARGEHHTRVWELVEREPGAGTVFLPEDLYPDARGCLERLRAGGYLLGLAGNAPREGYASLGLDVDFVACSAEWGVQKPDPAFFERVAEACARPPAEIAYVGDRVDNDVLPARAAGMLAVHVRRGPWGHLHEAPAGAPTIRSLDELPEVLRDA
jgi:HAD superfamily hydrolase (TIGR01509 family)